MAYLEQVAFADLCDEMQTSTNELALQAAMSRFVQRNGFEWFGYVAKTQTEAFGHSSYPAAWEALYVERSYQETDPVLVMAQREPLPFRWGGNTFVTTRQQRGFFSLASDFNVRHGLTVPIAGTFGSFAALTLAGPHNDNNTPSSSENLSYLTLAALHYHMQTDRVRQQLARAEEVPPHSQLSSRAKTCLTWIARGKTIEETAEILNVHEATVRFHLNEARRRLNAVSLPHLVAEALSRGEIVY